LGYDGTRFSGWARQPGRRTVQGVVEEAVGTVLRLGRPASLTVAGRTDAGVHARAQVAHTDVPAEAWRRAGQRLPEGVNVSDAIVRRLAGVLPDDIRVFRIAPAPPGFDARFSALRRRYAYRVSDNPGGLDPLRRHDVLWHKRPLDLDAMNLAAAGLLGEHDFAAFCRHREGATTIRRLSELHWQRAEGGLAVASIEADAFCHNMVRAMVGALLAVGDGRRPIDWPARVLRAGVRDPAVPVVPPQGLTLEQIRYPDTPDGMAARAAESRAMRS
jgi:tRNA pseudouridine38-40 synthase